MAADDATDSAPFERASEPDERLAFLNLAGKSYLILLIALLAAVLLLGVRPWQSLSLDPTDALIGLLAAIPLLLIVYVSADLNTLVAETLGPRLAACRLGDLVLLAIVGGVLEELLIRGVLQPGLVRLGLLPLTAIVAANLIFACGYAWNGPYFSAAFLAGCYLSALLSTGPTDNLLRPIVTHTTFVLVVSVLLASAARRRQAAVRPYDAAAPAT